MTIIILQQIENHYRNNDRIVVSISERERMGWGMETTYRAPRELLVQAEKKNAKKKKK